MRSLIWPNRFHSQSIGAALLLLLALVTTLPVGSVAAASTLHVTDCADSGTNTLRGLIASASAGDTIVYDQDCTTTLVSMLTIDKDLLIDGNGHRVILDGNNAVTIFTVNQAVTATIEDLTIQHGNGTSAGGLAGGINSMGTLTVIGVTLQDNTTSGMGGALQGYGPLTVINSAFITNNAQNGGGIVTYDAFMMTNSTLVDNTSFSTGSAVLIFPPIEPTPPIMIVNSTFLNNRSLHNTGSISYSNIGRTDLVTLTNVIVAGSTGGDLDYSYDRGFTGNHNLIDDDTIGLISGSDNIQAPALFGPLGDYGGPTQTIPLLPGSPAIDAGDDETCTATGSGSVNNLDQRGISRSHGDHCDIGAFESQGFTLTPVTGSTSQSTLVRTAFTNPLALTVTANDPNGPVDGGVISYTAPETGASAALSNATATIANGQASVTATANDTMGSYNVTASAGGDSSATFALTNTGTPDVTPPITTATAVLAGTSTDYSFGSWANQNVATTLTAADGTGATDETRSGVAHTYYTLDGGLQQTYSGPFTISADGDHSLTFWSVDNANNTETSQTVHIRIDKSPPTITYSGNQETYTVDQTVSIHCTAADQPDLSGIASTNCTDITGLAADFGAGVQTFSATATDNAGNTTTVSTTFTVGVTVNGLISLTAHYAGNRRTASQLSAPLGVVQLADRLHNQRMKESAINSYILLLNMQRGRGLSAQEVATLSQLARDL